MTKRRQYWWKASACFIYLLLAAGFHNIIAGLAHAESVSFQLPSHYVLGAGSAFESLTRPVPGAVVALGEFNGDGIKDLAVAHHGVGRLSVLLGNGRWIISVGIRLLPLGFPNPVAATNERSDKPVRRHPLPASVPPALPLS
jgi:hypothetical protein